MDPDMDLLKTRIAEVEQCERDRLPQQYAEALGQLDRQMQQNVHLTVAISNATQSLEKWRNHVDALESENLSLKEAIATLQADSSTLQRQNYWLKLACLVMGLGCILSFVKFL